MSFTWEGILISGVGLAFFAALFLFDWVAHYRVTGRGCVTNKVLTAGSPLLRFVRTHREGQ